MEIATEFGNIVKHVGNILFMTFLLGLTTAYPFTALLSAACKILRKR